VSAQVDAVLSRFVVRANAIRSQLNNQQLNAGSALDEVRFLGRGHVVRHACHAMQQPVCQRWR
jgi:hypothetical protein